MIKATDLRVGSKIMHNDDLWIITETMHRTPGKGQALMQVKMRSMTTGRSTNERFRSNVMIEPAILETQRMEYLYREDNLMTFMNNETYEQIQIDIESLGDAPNYLVEGMNAMIQFHDEKPLGIELAPKVELKVTQTEPAVKGDTVSNVTKAATLETGLVVQVPMFVQEGETLRISTESGAYVERVS